MTVIHQAETDTTRSPAQALIALAQLLHRVEGSGIAPDAGQYRALVHRLQQVLAEPMPPELLDAVMARHPSVAVLYENMNYAQAGLSRAPLERSVSTEALTTELLGRIARQARSAQG